MTKTLITADTTSTLARIVDRLNELSAAIGMEFKYEVGPKFIRVVDVAGRSVHAFVDHATGDLIKASGWKAPAKDKGGFAVRGNVLDADDFARLLKVADPYGSYLYKGAGKLDVDTIKRAEQTRAKHAEFLQNMKVYAAKHAEWEAAEQNRVVVG